MNLGKPAAKVAPHDTELTEEKVQADIKLVNESALANTLRRVIGNMLLFTRTSTGYCHDQFVCLHCRHLEQHCGKKTTLVLGYLDSSHANGLRRGQCPSQLI